LQAGARSTFTTDLSKGVGVTTSVYGNLKIQYYSFDRLRSPQLRSASRQLSIANQRQLYHSSSLLDQLLVLQNRVLALQAFSIKRRHLLRLLILREESRLSHQWQKLSTGRIR
jgi:hypothetical protein